MPVWIRTMSSGLQLVAGGLDPGLHLLGRDRVAVSRSSASTTTPGAKNHSSGSSSIVSEAVPWIVEL